MNYNPYQFLYLSQIFPLIRNCRNCTAADRYANAPHEYAVIGKNYGRLWPRILFLFQNPNVDQDTAALIANGQIPTDYDNYMQYNEKILGFFPTYGIYGLQNGIRDMMTYINTQLQSDFHLSLENFAFTNKAQCYNSQNGNQAAIDSRITQMMKNCHAITMQELEILSPHIVIGCFSGVLELFTRYQRQGFIQILDEREGYFKHWRFIDEDPAIKRLLVYLYHPIRSPGTYAQHGDTFHERLDIIIEYIRTYTPI